MSASREKKERQGGTPSNKAQAAKQQEEAARKKTIQYTVIGVVVAVLVAALLIWNTGFIQARSTAVSVNGTNYSVGEVSYYYYSAYQETAYYAQYMAQFGISSGYDTSRSPKDQIYSTDSETGEETTYYDYFLNSAMEDLVATTALYDAAVSAGYSAADVKDTVDSAIASAKQSASSNGYTYKQFLSMNYGKYVTPAVYEKVVTRSAVANLYYSDYSDSLSYTDADYQNYYQEHKDELDTFEYSYLYFRAEAVATTDADGNAIEMTDEEREAAQAKNLAAAEEQANAAMAALRGGKSAEDVIEEYEPTSSGADVSNEGSGLSSIYSEWLTAAERKTGDVTVIDNNGNGYYVVRFNGRYLDPTLSVNVRHILVMAETDEGASAPTEEQQAASKTRAEEILAQWQAGTATEESFAALADELSQDGRDEDGNLGQPGGLYEEIIPGGFVTPFNDWLFNEEARKPGDTGIVEVSSGAGYYGTHVAYFVGENEGDYAWQHGVKDTLVSQDRSEWLNGLKESYSATQAGGIKYVG